MMKMMMIAMIVMALVLVVKGINVNDKFYVKQMWDFNHPMTEDVKEWVDAVNMIKADMKTFKPSQELIDNYKQFPHCYSDIGKQYLKDFDSSKGTKADLAAKLEMLSDIGVYVAAGTRSNIAFESYDYANAYAYCVYGNKLYDKRKELENKHVQLVIGL